MTPPPVTPPETLSQVVGAYLHEQCTVIIKAEQKLREGEDVVHTTRVAVRRLRSTLRTFAELFDIPRSAQLEDELIWFASLLGEVRDLDILGARLDRAVAKLPPELVLGPVRSQLQTEITTQRKAAMQAVQSGLDGERYRGLLKALGEWREDTPFAKLANAPAAKATPYVKRAGKKMHQRLVDAMAAEEAGDPDAGDLLHRARKAGKRHRYAIELVEPLWGSKADRLIASRKTLQDLLGDHNDSLVSAEFLRSIGARYGARSGRNGFTYGLLYAREIDSRLTLPARLKPFL